MKISKDRLKQIIKEELTVGVVGGEPMHGGEEGGHDEYAGGEYPRDQHGYEGEMAKTNLWKIAERHYGKGKGAKFNVIFEANKPMLKDPDLIYPGQVLRIPDIEAAAKA